MVGRIGNGRYGGIAITTTTVIVRGFCGCRRDDRRRWRDSSSSGDLGRQRQIPLRGLHEPLRKDGSLFASCRRDAQLFLLIPQMRSQVPYFRGGRDFNRGAVVDVLERTGQRSAGTGGSRRSAHGRTPRSGCVGGRGWRDEMVRASCAACRRCRSTPLLSSRS